MGDVLDKTEADLLELLVTHLKDQQRAQEMELPRWAVGGHIWNQD